MVVNDQIQLRTLGYGTGTAPPPVAQARRLAAYHFEQLITYLLNTPGVTTILFTTRN